MPLRPPLPAIARRTVRDTLSGLLRMVGVAALHVHGWASRVEGRRRTQRILHTLQRTGWQICHDIALPDGGSVDLAVGLSGIYVLESKAWNGVVTVDLKGATITPRSRPSAAWTARGQHRALPPAAAAIVRALAASTGTAVPAPRPVVVIWASFPEQVAECGGVSYVAGDHLADWLTHQPRRLGTEESTALPGAAVWQGPLPVRLDTARLGVVVPSSASRSPLRGRRARDRTGSEAGEAALRS